MFKPILLVSAVALFAIASIFCTGCHAARFNPRGP